jgi:septal ring factor EnvC (AmiA/AmiB activator)
MSEQKNIPCTADEPQELTNWQKIDQLEAEIEKKKPKPKSKANVNALKERLRRLDVSYMAGNKTDEEYLKEQKDIKQAIAKIEKESPESYEDRDLTHLIDTLNTDFISLYEQFDDEDKRAFWRNIIKEIHVSGNDIVSVVFN